MYRRILVPTDGTELCSLALDTALRLAQLGGGAVVGLHTCAPRELAALEPLTGQARAALDEQCEQLGEEALAYVRRRAREAGVACDTVLVRDSAPYEAIERAAREYGCDLVVLAAHARRGLRARLVGGEAEKLLAHGTVPLLIVR